MYFRILIVDNDSSVHEVIKSTLVEDSFKGSKNIESLRSDFFSINIDTPLLETVSYSFDSAYHVEEAIEKIDGASEKGLPYSLIIMDSKTTSEIDVLAIIETIFNKYGNINIILLAKYSDLKWEDIKKRTKYKDQFVYLKKPFDINVLRQIVSMLVFTTIKIESIKKQVNSLEGDLKKRTKELNSTVEDYLQIEEKREQALAIKHQFISTVSHELRTPLTAAISIMKAFEKTNLDSEQNSYLKIVNETHEILLQILDNILDFSRLENNRLELYEILFDYKKLVKMQVKHMEEIARENGNHITLNIDDTIPDQLYGDPGKIRQIYTNLLGNAIKFTNNGTINVILEVLNEDNSSMTILTSIVDTGVGVDVSEYDTIFSYFSQADSGVHRKFGGTGIGLNVSKMLIEKMGGKIGVASKPGEGSNFTFYIFLKKV